MMICFDFWRDDMAKILTIVAVLALTLYLEIPKLMTIAVLHLASF